MISKKEVKKLQNKNLDLQEKINIYELILSEIYKLATSNNCGNKDAINRKIIELAEITKRETNSTDKSKVSF